MRGKQGRALGRLFGHRIIPAHAGQTLNAVAGGNAETDHPRACGANEQGRLMLRLLHGSSPRMRGKLVLLELVPSDVRIIPAHAGQTEP